MIKNLSDHRRDYQISYMNLARSTSSEVVSDLASIGLVEIHFEPVLVSGLSRTGLTCIFLLRREIRVFPN